MRSAAVWTGTQFHIPPIPGIDIITWAQRRGRAQCVETLTTRYPDTVGHLTVASYNNNLIKLSAANDPTRYDESFCASWHRRTTARGSVVSGCLERGSPNSKRKTLLPLRLFLQLVSQRDTKTSTSRSPIYLGL